MYLDLKNTASIPNSYQLPPMVSKKTAIVVSPLLSLMQDQVPPISSSISAPNTNRNVKSDQLTT